MTPLGPQKIVFLTPHDIPRVQRLTCLQRNSLPQHSVGLCRQPGVGCKKFPSEYPTLFDSLQLSKNGVSSSKKHVQKHRTRIVSVLQMDSPPLKLGNSKFIKHFASRCSFERARRRTRSDWSHVENEPQSSRETKWPQAKNCPKEQEKIYMLCDGTGCLVGWSIWHVQAKHCSVGKDLSWVWVAILRIQEAKPFREVHLWNEVQPMSPLSLNHVCTVLDGTAVWNSHLQFYIGKKQWTRKVIMVVGYAGNPSMETINWRSSCFQILLSSFYGVSRKKTWSRWCLPCQCLFRCFIFFAPWRGGENVGCAPRTSVLLIGFSRHRGCGP